MARCSGFLSQGDFWEAEGDAPILKFNNNDWLQGHLDEAIGHANGWLAAMRVEPSRVDLDLTPLPSEGARIFRADANRTYRSEPNRSLFIKVLSFSHSKIGDYQQSLGYVAGLMLLFFDPATVFKVLTLLNDSPKYLPGYWRGEATACAVDGYVCFNLLRQPVKDQLLKLGILPETFVQKWFSGLCIHHLPYHLLFLFLDRFFKDGNQYLFQFFLAFFEQFEEDVMSLASTAEGNLLIRLESAAEERLRLTIEAASEPRFVEIISKLDLHKQRCTAFDEHLSRRMMSANEGMWQKRDDDITFSDEED